MRYIGKHGCEESTHAVVIGLTQRWSKHRSSQQAEEKFASEIKNRKMKDIINRVLKNLHLLISLLIVVPTAIIYGSPSILQKHLDIQVNTIDLSNMLKAIMGLYLGVSFIWILGIWKTKFWKSATQLTILFMLTLAAGRASSMITDGLPTRGYIFGIIAECAIGLFSIYQLKKYSKE